jgi:hypothetical protein
MPEPRVGASISAVNGKIYVIGGRYIASSDPNTAITGLASSTLIYDPINDSWTYGANIPHPVENSASAVRGNQIYVFSGKGQSRSIEHFTQVYNSNNDSWQQTTSIPMGVASAVAVFSLKFDAFYVLGGTTGAPSNFVQIYFPQNASWSFGRGLPAVRFEMGTAEVNDTNYLISGCIAKSTGNLRLTNETILFNPAYSTLIFPSAAPDPSVMVSPIATVPLISPTLSPTLTTIYISPIVPADSLNATSTVSISGKPDGSYLLVVVIAVVAIGLVLTGALVIRMDRRK